MAIVMRRGNAADFKPQKMRAGEWAVCLDTQEIYMSFASGTATKLGTLYEFVTKLAPAYDTQSTYDVGDYCTHNDKLYVCVTAVTSPSNFNVNAWAETDVLSMVEGISGAQYTAGDNIPISDGVISAVDTVYTAGSNIAISENNEISALVDNADLLEVTVRNPENDSSVYEGGYKFEAPCAGVKSDILATACLRDLKDYRGAYAVETATDKFILYFDRLPRTGLRVDIHYTTSVYADAEEVGY